MNTVAIVAGASLLVFTMTLNPAQAQPSSAPGKMPSAPGSPATVTKTPTDPVLVTLHGQLENLLKSSQPLATITWDTSDGVETLIAQYQTQSFLIYGRGTTGRFAAVPDAETGPNFQGFRLKLGTRPGHYESLFTLPQELRGPYWTTYINAVPLKSVSRYLWVSLSYGDKVDALLLKQLKQIVHAAGS